MANFHCHDGHDKCFLGFMATTGQLEVATEDPTHTAYVRQSRAILAFETTM